MTLRFVTLLGPLCWCCATARLPPGAGDAAPAAKTQQEETAYQEVLARFTRSLALYDNLDTRGFVRATWQSDAFVEARVTRDASFRGFSEQETSQLLARELKTNAEATAFFVTVYVTDYRTDDFEKANSIWRVTALHNGVTYPVKSIARLGRTSPQLRAIYPHMEQFWVAYWMVFPKVEGVSAAAPLTLKLASSIGQAELVFF
jgi:hypothetical protein